jgi:surface antigen
MITSPDRRRLWRAALTTSFLALLVSTLLSVPAAPASAGADDYPYKAATCASTGSTTGRCPNYDWRFEGREFDPWGFAFRNCTSWVAWRMRNTNGADFFNTQQGGRWGNANTWDDNARRLGYPVNSTPARGAIAQTDAGSFGHVAWVDAVNADGTVTVEDYNNAGTGAFARRTVAASSFVYIHVKDIGGSPPPPPPTDPRRTTTASDGANLRADTNTSAPVKTVIPPRTSVYLECWRRGQPIQARTGTYDLWHQVSYGGQTGFVSDTTLNTPAFPNAGANQPAAGEPECSAPPPPPPPPPPPAKTKPAPPVSVTATPGDGSATVSWTAPADGGDPITGYTVTARPDCRRPVVQELPGSARSTTLTLVNGTAYAVSVSARNGIGTSDSSSPVRVTPVDADLSTYTAVDPLRILDTRNGGGNVGAPAARLGKGQFVDLKVTGGPRGVPADARAVVLNVTVVNASGATDVRVFPTPTGERAAPRTSNINAGPGTTVANLVVARVGQDGKVRLLNSGADVDLLADIAGYYTAGTAAASLVSVAPVRVLDTRPGGGNTGAPAGAVGPTDFLDLELPRALVPQDATAVVLNVTAVSPTADTDVRVYPTPTGDGPAPQVSNINLPRGLTKPNLVVVKLGDGGRVRLRNAAGEVHLLADVAGYYTRSAPAESFHPADPVRVLDTRPASVVGPKSGSLTAGEVVDLAVAGTGGVPADASAVVLNVTAVAPSTSTDIRVYPAGGGSAFPNVSNLNAVAGLTVPNLVVVKVGEGGKVRFRNSSGSVFLLADLAGWFER